MTADIAIACICALNVILNCYIILKKLNPAPINITKHETINWEECKQLSPKGESF